MPGLPRVVVAAVAAAVCCAGAPPPPPAACADVETTSLLQTRLTSAPVAPAVALGADAYPTLGVDVVGVPTEAAFAVECTQKGPFILPKESPVRLHHEPIVQAKGVCATPQNASSMLQKAVAKVLQGLPRWTAETPRTQATVRIAYLVQVAVEAKLPMVRRVFDRLYSEEDTFLYLSDARLLDPGRVEQALGVAGADARENVHVRAASHTGFYTWPRVQVVLDAVESLMKRRWDFFVHLSDSDYPLHTADWLRSNFARQRDSSFMRLIPRCTVGDALPDGARELERNFWAMWCGHPIVASCGSAFAPDFVSGTRFPREALEGAGMQFAHGPEWVAVTRELAEYAIAPGLEPFRQMIGVHIGADEMFWQTLVLNIPHFTQKIARQRWFIEWSNPKQHSPDTITDAHVPTLLRSRGEFLFTRKVESPASDAALAILDDTLANDGPASLDDLPQSGWELRRSCVP